MKKLSVLLTIFSSLVFHTALQAEDHEKELPQKAILVTGASSGLGAKITETLAANGFLVYATARKDADLKRLNEMDNVESIRLDVTKQEQIDAAVEYVREQGRGLYGLVNNAGVVILGPLTEVPVEEMEFQMDVNVTGPYRVTQAFAPLIIESKGRITTTGSISGILAGNMFGIYAMSKHAIEAYTDSLATELARFDVKVSVVEPGNFKSNIGGTFAKRYAEKGYLKEGSAYLKDMEALTARMDSAETAKEPTPVAEAVLHAMTSDRPKLRYMVTPSARSADVTIRQSLREMLQLNQDQEFTFDRDTLIKMMDEVAAEL